MVSRAWARGFGTNGAANAKLQGCVSDFSQTPTTQSTQPLSCSCSPFWGGWGVGGATRCQHAQWEWYSFLYQSITQHLHVQQPGSICSLADVQIGGPTDPSWGWRTLVHNHPRCEVRDAQLLADMFGLTPSRAHPSKHETFFFELQ